MKSGHSRPGAKAEMGTNKRIIRARGHEFLVEDEGRYARISIRIDGEWEHAATVNTDKRTASEWIESNAQPGSSSKWLPYAMSRPGAKVEMAKRFDAKIVGDELVRSDGRRYRITGRKPSLPKARELQGELEWVMMVGNNGAEYSVQRFEDGGYRVFGGGMGMTVQWEGLLRASRPGAKEEMRRMTQQEQSHMRAWIARNLPLPILPIPWLQPMPL